MHGPQALLLDEATAGLDLAARHRFLALLRPLAERGITLIQVTHHVEEILPETVQVILLRAGRVLADGARADVLTSELLSQAYGGPLRVRQEGGVYSASGG